jgi:hypothetical protein
VLWQHRQSTALRYPEEAPELVHEAIRSPSRELDARLRDAFERGYGHDFSTVRVHDDPVAARSARALDASAYAVGKHLVFGEGAFAPNTAIGWELLAHELAHVVQQGGSADPLDAPALQVGAVDASAELDAEHRTASFIRGEQPRFTPGTSGLVLRRQLRDDTRRQQGAANEWEGGAPGGAGKGPSEQFVEQHHQVPIPFVYESENAREYFPQLPIFYNAFTVAAGPFTRAFTRVHDYVTLGIPEDPASLPASITHMFSMTGTSADEREKVQSVTSEMTSADSNVTAAYRRVEAFQTRMMGFTSRLEVAKTKLEEYETRQEIGHVQAELHEVLETKELIDDILGTAGKLIGMAGALGVFGEAAGLEKQMEGGLEVAEKFTWALFSSKIQEYQEKIAKLQVHLAELEKKGVTLGLEIAEDDLKAAAKELEAETIGLEQTVLHRRHQAAHLGTALEAAHPHAARKLTPGTTEAVTGMATAVREAAFFAKETRTILEGIDAYKFVERAEMFPYLPGHDDPVHRDKLRMMEKAHALLVYKKAIWREQPALERLAAAWTKLLNTPTGTIGSP